MSDKQKSLKPFILVSTIISVSIFGGVALLSISGNTFNFFPTINPTPPTEIITKNPTGNTSDSSQPHNETIDRNGRQTPSQPYPSPVVSPRASDETNQQPAFAKYPGAVDLAAEMRSSGFGVNYSSSFDKWDFVLYGTATLRKDLDEAQNELGRTQFNKEVKQAEVDAVKRKIDVKRTGIRSKVFFLGSEKYFVSEVVDNGDDSRFTMVFIAPEPMGVIFTIPEGIAKEIVLPMQGVKVDKVGFAQSVFTWGSRISLRVIGSADSLNELVSNKENYRVHLWFNNFRCGDTGSYSANPNNLNPLADVLKIEIVKVD